MSRRQVRPETVERMRAAQSRLIARGVYPGPGPLSREMGCSKQWAALVRKVDWEAGNMPDLSGTTRIKPDLGWCQAKAERTRAEILQACRILEAKGQRISVLNVAEVAGYHWRTVKTHLRALRAEGLIPPAKVPPKKGQWSHKTREDRLRLLAFARECHRDRVNPTRKYLCECLGMSFNRVSRLRMQLVELGRWPEFGRGVDWITPRQMRAAERTKDMLPLRTLPEWRSDAIYRDRKVYREAR